MLDPDDSPVNGPFFDDDSLLLFSQPNAQPNQGAPACVPTQETLSVLANKVMGSPQSLGNQNASFTTARGTARMKAGSSGKTKPILASGMGGGGGNSGEWRVASGEWRENRNKS
jgi:hypothetical protein